MLKFRKDINGLRALAVISVVLYHFNIPLFSGGFSGVDIFFVISGYLMTGIIYSKLNSNTFSIIGFYLDRARRIIPALSFTCFLVFIVCWFFLTPTDFEDLGIHIYSSLLFISNITYFQGINYFDAAASQKWLLHTWSLSVEWQFYIILPLLMAFVFKLNKLFIRPILILLFVSSFAWSVYLTKNGFGSEAFYLLPSRAWEMLLGGLIFLFPVNYKLRAKIAIHYISVMVMLLGVFSLNKFDLWPGYLALIPVASAALFISSAHESFLFTNKIAQFIGKISYSVYLCHWPVVVAISYFSLHGIAYYSLGIIISLILGTMSFFLIENPARRFLNGEGNHLFKEILILISILFLPMAISVYASENGGLPSRFPYALLTSEDIAKERARYWVDGDKENPVPVSGKRKIVIIGNSHGVDLTYALTENGLKGNITYLRTTSYCSNFGFTPNYPQYQDKCPSVFQRSINNKALNNADVVFMHDDWEKEDLHGLSQSLNEYISKTKAHIYVIGPKMTYTKSALDIVASSMGEKKTTVKMVNEYSKDFYSKRKIKTDLELKKFFSEHSEFTNRVSYISAMDVQCGNNYNCEILSDNDKSFYYFDAGHFTLNGSVNFGIKLKKLHPELFQ